MGLEHSARYNDPPRNVYTDPLDPMSSVVGLAIDNDESTGPVCMSAPQAYTAGWATPIAALTLADLAPGVPRSFAVPPMASNKPNMVRIVVDGQPGVPGAERALYISYRQVERARTSR
ncbi:hypothetical protein GPECTOR_1481g664 [Gonium pectorale]|uniref:Peptidase M11 gametolysin domain-containing protein n=1 Tax=Gonium pectorale TaxID=33097 RepID=A0A150FTE0_GONPE|nr:hypothetical protein GPECTOR_1481g664 [Gonium pectorale]|eukprot:KXZ40893.1 hypothetical protein GPECTOR_1481g664 [Gonium pectorale]